jgi:hypothetical protein
MPASIGPPTRPTPTPKAERPKDIPLDLFAPPDAEESEMKVDLAPDEIEHRERKRVSVPPETRAPASPTTPTLQRKSAPSLQTPNQPVAIVAPDPSRTRFAAGVLVAIVLGFLPAHLIASVREDSAFKKIDDDLIEVQAAAYEPDAAVPAAKLDSYREAQKDLKKTQRRNIALVSMVIWAIVGGGIAVVWFRVLGWGRRDA